MRKIKAIVKKPDSLYGKMVNIIDSLENLQSIVGGYLETIYINDDLVIICNEEGLIQNLPENMRWFDQTLVGTIIICGMSGSELCDIGITFREWKYLVNANGANIRIPKNSIDLTWHVVDSDDSDTFPHTKDYILLSFENYSLTCVGRCEGNEDEGFTFYEADDDIPLTNTGLIVNAWMPLPERWCSDDI